MSLVCCDGVNYPRFGMHTVRGLSHGIIQMPVLFGGYSNGLSGWVQYICFS